MKLLAEPPFPELLAQRFHDAYERLAPHYGYKTRDESAVPWEDVPEQNRALMIATCAVVEEELRSHVVAAGLSALDSRPCKNCGKPRGGA